MLFSFQAKMSSTPPSPPTKKMKVPRSKPVCPSPEQKILVVTKMLEHRHLLFFEKTNSLQLLNAKEDVLKLCHNLGLMYADYLRVKKAYRDWRVPVIKEVRESKRTGQGATEELSELAKLLVELEHGNGRFEKDMEVCKFKTLLIVVLKVVSISNHKRCTFCPQIVNLLSDSFFIGCIVRSHCSDIKIICLL
jgi:hypothetical protein